MADLRHVELGRCKACSSKYRALFKRRALIDMETFLVRRAIGHVVHTHGAGIFCFLVTTGSLPVALAVWNLDGCLREFVLTCILNRDLTVMPPYPRLGLMLARRTSATIGSR